MITSFNAKVQEVNDLAKDKNTIEEKVTIVHDFLKEHVTYKCPYQTSTEEEANWNALEKQSNIYGRRTRYLFLHWTNRYEWFYKELYSARWILIFTVSQIVH